MLNTLVVALSLAASGQCATCPTDFGPGMSTGSWSAGIGPNYPSFDAVAAGGGGGGDQLYPFDATETWLRGYFQDMPTYGGYATFRPHNYKDVLAQTQLAGNWGMNPTMAYSHQWYHRYRNRSGMHPSFGVTATGRPGFQNMAQAAPAPAAAAPYAMAAAQPAPQSREQALQQAAAIQRGYPGTPIPGISTPYYQRAQLPQGNAASNVAAEMSEKFDALQQQLEQQTFQMQLMQQQWQDRAAPTQQPRPAWDQPAYQQFPGAGQPAAAVQDVPGPSTYQPMMTGPAPTGTAAFGWQGAQAMAPQMLPQPAVQPVPYASGPQPQPMAQPQPMLPSNGMNYGPAQPGPIMQLPAGQPWPTTQPMMPAQPAAAMPMAQPIPGSHAGWQQAAPTPGAGGWNSYGTSQPGVPDQVFFPQPYDGYQPQQTQTQPYYIGR